MREIFWKVLDKLAVGSLFSVALYYGGIYYGNIYNPANHPQIKNMKKLEQVFLEEKHNLGLDDKLIYLHVNDSKEKKLRKELGLPPGPEVGRAISLTDGSYLIELDFEKGCNRPIIKHELYHIADGHFENALENEFLDDLKYSILDEPQAILYSAFGWRL